MFDSPIKNTFLLLVFFTTICGVGLQKVLHFPEVSVSNPVDLTSKNVYSGWINIRSAHPFRSSKILIDGEPLNIESFTKFEGEAEVSLNEDSLVKVEVAWPEGTPETALLFSLDLDGAPSFEKTFWAQSVLHAEFTPTL